MKKLSKLLALLLALVMVFSLAACGADGEDKENTDDTGSAVVDNNDEKQEPSAEEMIAGEWQSRFDLSDAMNLMMAASMGDISLIPNTEVYMDLTFKFADEKFVMTMAVDQDSIEAYMAALADNMVDYMYTAYEAQGVTKDVLDAQIEDAYGMTMKEYVNAMMEESLEGALDEMNYEAEAVYYRVDAESGRIYVAEEKSNLEDSKEYMEYTVTQDALTVTNFVEENAEETVSLLENLGMELPWTFEKK